MTTDRKRRPGSRRQRRKDSTSWAVLIPGLLAMEYDPTFTPSLEQQEKNQKATGKDTA